MQKPKVFNLQYLLVGVYHTKFQLYPLWLRELICICVVLQQFSFRRGFPGGSDSKVFAYSVGDMGSIPGLGRSPGEGNSNPL